MEVNDLFVVATKNKFRFPFRGMVSAEDLWDLKLTDLDAVFKTLNSEAKKTKEDSLLETKSSEDAILEAKIEIIKFIVKSKQKDAENKRNERANKEQRDKILKIIADKQDNELQSKSVDELKAILAGLDT